MKKNRVVLFLIVAILSYLLIGCGGTGSAPNGSNPNQGTSPEQNEIDQLLTQYCNSLVAKDMTTYISCFSYPLTLVDTSGNQSSISQTLYQNRMNITLGDTTYDKNQLTNKVFSQQTDYTSVTCTERIKMHMLSNPFSSVDCTHLVQFHLSKASGTWKINYLKDGNQYVLSPTDTSLPIFSLAGTIVNPVPTATVNSINTFLDNFSSYMINKNTPSIQACYSFPVNCLDSNNYILSTVGLTEFQTGLTNSFKPSGYSLFQFSNRSITVYSNSIAIVSCIQKTKKESYRYPDGSATISYPEQDYQVKYFLINQGGQWKITAINVISG
jgi:hypothetical protein